MGCFILPSVGCFFQFALSGLFHFALGGLFQFALGGLFHFALGGLFQLILPLVGCLISGTFCPQWAVSFLPSVGCFCFHVCPQWAVSFLPSVGCFHSVLGGLSHAYLIIICLLGSYTQRTVCWVSVRGKDCFIMFNR